MTFYERLEKLRKERGISQGKLEKALDFSNGSISKWKNSIPTAERIQKVADYFNVSVSYLMTGKEDDNNQRHLDIILYLKNTGALNEHLSKESLIEIEQLAEEISDDKEFKEEQIIIETYRNNQSFKRFLQYYMRLSELGRKKALDNVEDLHKIYNIDHTMYIEPKAAHGRTDIEPTEEMKQNDNDIMNDPEF